MRDGRGRWRPSLDHIRLRSVLCWLMQDGEARLDLSRWVEKRVGDGIWIEDGSLVRALIVRLLSVVLTGAVGGASEGAAASGCGEATGCRIGHGGPLPRAVACRASTLMTST